jgi:toxin ParE1/3/4
MRVVWDDDALRDLETIAAYIAPNSASAARRVISYLRDKAQLLDSSPELGRASREAGVRELIASRYPYIIVYELDVHEVRIVAVVHQSRDRS